MENKDFVTPLLKTYELTQKELADILDWSVATLSRFQNGKGANRAYGRILKIMQNPAIFYLIVKDALDEDPTNKFLKELLEKVRKKATASIPELLSEIQKSTSRSRREIVFSQEKFINAILFFSVGQGVWKTKLNKLLFFADFLSHKRFKKPITGARYKALPFGPVPEDYGKWYSILSESGEIEIREEALSDDVVGEKILAKKGVNTKVFTCQELKILEFVREFFEDKTTKETTNISHEEEAYYTTSIGDFIPYEKARTLKLGSGCRV